MKLRDILNKHFFVEDSGLDFPIDIYLKTFYLDDGNLEEFFGMVEESFRDYGNVSARDVCAIIRQELKEYKTSYSSDESPEYRIDDGDEANEFLERVEKHILRDLSLLPKEHIAAFCERRPYIKYPYTINSSDEDFKIAL